MLSKSPLGVSASSDATNPPRLLALMAIFAFTSFAAVDPFMTQASVWPLIKVRAMTVLVLLAVLALLTTAFGKRHPTLLGGIVGSWTGIGVVILTEMTGGAASPYWTMVMLTFFTVALVLPMTVAQAILCFGSVALFYIAWFVSFEATASTLDWVMSNAGIWLSLVVSVAAVGFLGRVRREQETSHSDLARLNESLRNEMAVREQAEGLVLRSQQLDAVGQLAAGMAHELNNLLMIISGASESLQSGRGDLMKETKRIIDVAQRGGKLTTDLLRYARKGQTKNERFALSTLVEEVADTVSATHRDRIRVTLAVTAEATWVCGDSALLRQVLLNLCLNGIDAMDGNGELTIQLVTAPERAELSLSVRDTGKGMTDVALSRAFEPFFTTKEPGKGTGLGLSMAYGTIQDHDGSITFETELERGTCVTVTLPLSDAPVLSSEEPAPPAVMLPNVTALLVDDDDLVRAVLTDLLEAVGMQIIEASNGPAALELLKHDDKGIDVVILDMVMPVMDGEEIFAKLRESHPALPVLICSGYVQQDAMLKFEGATHCAFLAKPCEAWEMVTALVTLLREASNEDPAEPKSAPLGPNMGTG